MKVITFASPKGGTAKTTLTYNFALMAAAKSQVFITDLDPQGSLQEIWKRRNEMVNPRLITDVESVAKSVRLLTQAGYGREFMFVDTPGSLWPVITDAVAASDVIVLTAQPSPIDLSSVEALAVRIDKMGLSSRLMILLTRCSNKEDTKHAVDFLSMRTPHPILTISERVDYKRAADQGVAAWEFGKGNRDIKAETKKAWDLMQKIMNQDAATGAVKADDQRIH